MVNYFNIYNVELSTGVVNSILYTFIRESSKKSIARRRDEDDDYTEQILCRVMEILESCLDKKKHYSLFSEFRIAILFALMMYSRTDPSEEQNMYEEPHRFS